MSNGTDTPSHALRETTQAHGMNDSRPTTSHMTTCPEPNARTTSLNTPSTRISDAPLNVHPPANDEHRQPVINDTKTNVRPPPKHATTAPPTEPRNRDPVLVNDARANALPPA